MENIERAQILLHIVPCILPFPQFLQITQLLYTPLHQQRKHFHSLVAVCIPLYKSAISIPLTRHCRGPSSLPQQNRRKIQKQQFIFEVGASNLILLLLFLFFFLLQKVKYSSVSSQRLISYTYCATFLKLIVETDIIQVFTQRS